MIIGILQNAWSPVYAGGVWPRRSWLKALHRSRSGQRLAILTGACPQEFWWDNTTPIVGDSPNSIVPHDLDHIATVLKQPHDYVVAFGRLAAKALDKLNVEPLLIVPHPAHRLVTNELYARAGRLLNDGFNGTVELRQLQGSIEVLATLPATSGAERNKP